VLSLSLTRTLLRFFFASATFTHPLTQRIRNTTHRSLACSIIPIEPAFKIRLRAAKFQVLLQFIENGKATLKFTKPYNFHVLISRPKDPQALANFIDVMSDIADPGRHRRNAPPSPSSPSSSSDASPTPSNRKRKKREGDFTSPSTKKKKSKSLKTLTSSATRRKKAKRMVETLIDEQKRVVLLCLNGSNVFFTGSAGTGKSFLMRRIIECLPVADTHVTSSTGIAAVNIGGQTVFNWAGVGAGEGTIQSLTSRILRNRESTLRWRQTNTLIIDEISMLDGKFFIKLEAMARIIRNNTLPFGGIQIILTGDFFQLPPVTKTTLTFCFQTAAWARTIRNNTVLLSTVFRQADRTFVKVLNELRRGNCSDKAVSLLETRATEFGAGHEEDVDDGIVRTMIYPRRDEVERMNTEKLHQLISRLDAGESRVVAHARDFGDGVYLQQLKNSCPARATIELVVGVQVILLRNIDVAAGLCNGSRGVVIGFDRAKHPRVRFMSGHEHTVVPEKWTQKVSGVERASREQLPLELAWAISIHKSQGITLAKATVDLTNIFEYGQAYVALSRVQSLAGLRVTGFNRLKVRANPLVTKFYAGIEVLSRLPLAAKEISSTNGATVSEVVSVDA
jgi:ATP-dependent DNA helicase PIF1